MVIFIRSRDPYGYLNPEPQPGDFLAPEPLFYEPAVGDRVATDDGWTGTITAIENSPFYIDENIDRAYVVGSGRADWLLLSQLTPMKKAAAV